MQFRATLLQSGKTAVGMQVPDHLVEALGAGKRPPVRVTINGYTYRNTIAVMGGVYMVGVSAGQREKAHVAGGDDVDVDVDIELDTQPRELALPDDFRALLDADPDAWRTFESLSYSRKQALVLPIDQAKTAETRQRRLDKALNILREGRAWLLVTPPAPYVAGAASAALDVPRGVVGPSNRRYSDNPLAT